MVAAQRVCCSKFTIFLLLIMTLSKAEPVYRVKQRSKGSTEPSGPSVNCGYRQCHQTKEGALNVHIIPHSHMDAGWVKTFDQYYYGTRTASSTANVQLIYHSVMTELQHDKRRKFVLSETSYFWKWWKEQKLNMRNLFRRMVQEGRIEIVGGGWVQADEAVTHYQSIIDQYTWGLRRINDTLGRCGRPRAAWQIDTYGHSRESANLLAQMGYDGLFLGRVDYRYREDLMDEGRMDMIWRGSDILGKASDIFTNVMFNLYNAPEGFCFDFLCTDEPIMDDLDSPIYNADRRADEFITMLERQARFYDFDNILVPMGGDFTYQSAANWFVNIDKLMTVINARQRNSSDINIFYSTPSCYLKAIYLEGHRDKTLYSEKLDFFPYGSDLQTFWTGFYSSRPALKYLERVANNFLQIAKQLTVLARSPDTFELHQLRTAVALMQHHDAITGTSQDHVVKDYARLLSRSMSESANLVVAYLSQLITNSTSHKRPQFPHMLPIQTCHLLNISECKVSEQSENFVAMVYNPLSHPVTYYVRLPILGNLYTVRDSNDDEMEVQIVPLSPALINIPGRKSKAIQELVFEAAEIPPLGYSSYYVSLRNDDDDLVAYNQNLNRATEDTGPNPDVDFIANKEIKVQIDTKTGMLQSITLPRGVKIGMTQNFYYYTPSMATANFQTSGAYSFRPQNDIPLEISDSATYKIIRGPLVEEVHQRFSDWVSQVIRVYRAEHHAEFEWIIGPIPVGAELGKEVVTRFTANLTTNGIFYTDANGRQMVKRASWSDRNGEPVKKSLSANFYPVTTKLVIKDTNRSIEVALLTDRPQGGTSLEDGEIEMMIHRRILTDDGFGMEEPLNEEEHGLGLVIKGQHFLMAGDFKREDEASYLSNKQRELEDKKHTRPWVFVGDAENLGHRKWSLAKNKGFSALNKYLNLPPFIKILTLEPWRGNTILLRLENTLEKDEVEPEGKRYKGLRKKLPAFEYYAKRSLYMADNDELDPDPQLDAGAVVRFDLRKVFTMFRIKSVRETTLAANQWLREARQMDWSSRFIYAGADDGVSLGGAIDAQEPDDPFASTPPYEASDPTASLDPTMAPTQTTSESLPATTFEPTASYAQRSMAPSWSRKTSKQRPPEQEPSKKIGPRPGSPANQRRRRRSTTASDDAMELDGANLDTFMQVERSGDEDSASPRTSRAEVGESTLKIPSVPRAEDVQGSGEDSQERKKKGKGWNVGSGNGNRNVRGATENTDRLNCIMDYSGDKEACEKLADEAMMSSRRAKVTKMLQVDYFDVEATDRFDIGMSKSGEDEGLLTARDDDFTHVMRKRGSSVYIDHDDGVTRPLVELFYDTKTAEDRGIALKSLPSGHHKSRAFTKYAEISESTRNVSGRSLHQQSRSPRRKGAETGRLATKRRRLGYSQDWGTPPYQRNRVRGQDRDSIYYDEEEDHRLASRPMMSTTSSRRPVLSDPEESDDYNAPVESPRSYGERVNGRHYTNKDSVTTTKTISSSAPVESEPPSQARQQILAYLKKEESQDLHHQVKDKLREKLKSRTSRIKRHNRKPPDADERLEGGSAELPAHAETQHSEGFMVSLRPTQIRTFVLGVYYP